MFTPLEIQELGEPIEDVYTRMTNDLLRNIARHIKSPVNTGTARWEIQKLSELGQLTQENAEIINRHIKSIPEAVRAMMDDTRRDILAQIERDMEAAAKAGYTAPPLRDSTVDVLRDMLEQAENKLNLTNTNMLQSSVDYYTALIMETARTVRDAETQHRDLLARAGASLDIINTRAAAYAERTETFNAAVRHAIRDLNKHGLTGFVDRANRHWSPEAYVNMVIRTTAHNTAIQSTRARMQDYGVEVFQISAHAGARPRCYPYQGWFCCWERADAGEITLGNGQTVQYVSIYDTSYGEAAGIFGINCGHYPIPMVEGYSYPTAQEDIQSAEENARIYRESQVQRALEREIRAAKRNVELLGDLATDEDREKVKAAQAEMRAFIAETGRPRRYDREQIN